MNRLPGFTLAVALVWCAGCNSQSADLTPDQTVLKVSQGLAANQPDVVWTMLPASYQSDVNSLVRDAAGKMDAELYKAGADILKKAVKVLVDKKALLVGMAPPNGPVDKAQIEQNYDGMVSFVSTLVNSELSDLDKLKSFDGGKFLSGAGAKLMKESAALAALSGKKEYSEAMAKFKGTKATIVSNDGKTAVVKIKAPGEEANSETFVKVEGKWLPKDLVDEWSKNIAKAKEEIAKFDPQAFEVLKPMILGKIKQADGALDQLLAANTPEEFQGAAFGAFLSIGAPLMGGFGGGPGPGDFGPGGPGDVPDTVEPSLDSVNPLDSPPEEGFPQPGESNEGDSPDDGDAPDDSATPEDGDAPDDADAPGDGDDAAEEGASTEEGEDAADDVAPEELEDAEKAAAE